MKLKYKIVTGMIVGAGMLSGCNEQRFTGVVRAKQNKKFFISPVNDTLVNRVIDFDCENYRLYRDFYDYGRVGDTVHLWRDEPYMLCNNLEEINGLSLREVRRLMDVDKLRRKIGQPGVRER